MSCDRCGLNTKLEPICYCRKVYKLCENCESLAMKCSGHSNILAFLSSFDEEANEKLEKYWKNNS